MTWQELGRWSSRHLDWFGAPLFGEFFSLFMRSTHFLIRNYRCHMHCDIVVVVFGMLANVHALQLQNKPMWQLSIRAEWNYDIRCAGGLYWSSLFAVWSVVYHVAMDDFDIIDYMDIWLCTFRLFCILNTCYEYLRYMCRFPSVVPVSIWQFYCSMTRVILTGRWQAESGQGSLWVRAGLGRGRRPGFEEA